MGFLRSIVFAFISLSLPFAIGPAGAQQPIKVTSDVQYQHIGHWDAKRLNRILTTEFPAFAGVPVTYSPATNGVNLYRVTYSSVIPERGNKAITTTGLVAIPDLQNNKSFPLISYQHGTVYGKNEVPSFPEESPETQLMLAQFGGQGYVVIGADYFGMGKSEEPEGYMVKGSHQQATFDMLMASRAVLEHLDIDITKSFLGGWSQGGFVTMAMLEKLEKEGIKIHGAATASAPVDVAALLNGFLSFPRPIDAAWVNSVIILSSFAFENYYGVPGLARSVINDEYYDISRKAYERQPFNPSDVPTDLHKLIRAEYFDPQFFSESAYGRLAAKTTAYRWIYKTPVRNYYGEADEAISVGVGRLAMTYQQAVGSGNMGVTAISTGKTTHRGTYAVSVPEWKKWFDSLLSAD